VAQGVEIHCPAIGADSGIPIINSLPENHFRTNAYDIINMPKLCGERNKRYFCPFPVLAGSSLGCGRLPG
jgi:hypothetical protein